MKRPGRSRTRPDLIPCPECGSDNIRGQESDIDPEKLVKAWAKTKHVQDWLKGPYFMCLDCRHKGPSVDCSGRKSSDVFKDEVYAEMLKLWNGQDTKPKMCGRCYDVVDRLFLSNCAENPEKLAGAPIGQYHCPDCGAMVIAGLRHPLLCHECLDKCLR